MTVAGGGSVGGGGGGGGAGGGGKPGNKPNTKGAAKPKLFDTARWEHARVRLSDFSSMTRERCQGTLPSVLFVASVSLGLAALGIFFVYIGDEKYIVDVMVLGGLCLAVSFGSFLIGFIFVLRPIYNERQRLLDEERRERATEAPTSVLDSYFNPTLRMDETVVKEPVPSCSTAPPAETVMYDKDSLRGATHDSTGKLTPPSPPPLVHPLKDRPGTTSTLLTATESDDVFHMEDDIGVAW